MRGRGAGCPVVAAVVVAAVGLLGPAAGAAAAEPVAVEVDMGRWKYVVGSQLSDASAQARVPVTVHWRQQVEGDVDEQLIYYDDSQGVHDEDSRYEGGTGPASYATSMPADGWAVLNMFTLDGEAVVQTSASRTSTLLQEQGLSRSRGWRTASCSCLSGGGALVSTEGGARASSRFTGSALALVTSVGPTRGEADVYVDGVLAGTVDTQRPAGAPRVVAFQRSWPERGHHAVTVIARERGVTLDALLLQDVPAG